VKTVLLVDDDSFTIEIMRAMLEKVPAFIYTAANAREALQQLASDTAPYGRCAVGCSLALLPERKT